MRLLILILFLSILGSCNNSEINKKTIPKTPYKADSVTMVFSGDIMGHLPQIIASEDYKHWFENIEKIWRKVDFTVVNFETTVSYNGIYSGYPAFASPSTLVKNLKQSGVDILAFANNHTLDRGVKGIRETLKIAKENNLKIYGCYDDMQSKEYLMLNKNGFKIALLNYTYGTNGNYIPKNIKINLIDTALISKHIEQAKQEKASHIIVFYHWGYEYHTKQNKHQEILAKWTKQQGVDVVIGSHPHVVQQIDTINNIVYSLGNFVSNQKWDLRDIGLSVELTLYKKSKTSIKPILHCCQWQNSKYIIHTEKDFQKLPQKEYFEKAMAKVKQNLFGKFTKLSNIEN